MGMGESTSVKYRDLERLIGRKEQLEDVLDETTPADIDEQQAKLKGKLEGINLALDVLDLPLLKDSVEG